MTTTAYQPEAAIAPQSTEQSRKIALALATVLVGLSAGFFFTYQASVLLGLAQVDDVTYVKTFQAINATIRNPFFAVVFFGPLPALALALRFNWRSMRKRAALAAALALYLATIAITFAGNVPMNRDLEAQTDISPAAATQARADFEADWNRLNLYRTGTTIGALVLVASVASTRKD